MAWILKWDQNQLEIPQRGRRVVGRSDFPGHAVFSRKHFEIYMKEGRVFVVDLGSTNGTTVSGIRLKPDIPMELRENDTIVVGATVMVLSQKRSHRREDTDTDDSSPVRVLTPDANTTELLYVDAGILIVLLAVRLLLDSTSVHGLALGTKGLLIVFILLLIPVLVTSTAAKIVLRLPVNYTSKEMAIYAVSVMVSSVIMNVMLWSFANSNWNAKDILSEARIEYYCLRHFSQNKCVVEIFKCPDCAQQIERRKRDLMVEKLRQAQAHESGADGQPAPGSQKRIPSSHPSGGQ